MIMTNSKKTMIAAAVLCASSAWFACAAGACCGLPPAETAEAPAKVEELKPQATCPVMGGAIDKNVFVDVKGVRIFVCCKGCIDKIKADPDTYIAKVKANGETLAASPTCEKCKNAVGSEKCCK